MGTLARYAHLAQEPQPSNAMDAARKAYAETQGEVVLINRSWLVGWADRKQLELLAEKAGVAPRRKK